jgi:hypothetical protein
MSTSEKTMAALAFLGLIVAILTGVIFWEQMRQMRIDQRAWVVLSSNNAEFEFPRNELGETTVSLPLTLTNTGKTPAKKYFVEVVTEINPNQREVSFQYAKDHTGITAGTLYPNSPVKMTAQLVQGNPKAATGLEPRGLSASEYQELLEGRTYLAVYARGEYFDIFGDKHWFHFCIHKSLSPTIILTQSRSCSEYNDADND